MDDKYQVAASRRRQLAETFSKAGAADAEDLAFHLVDLAEACEDVAAKVSRLAAQNGQELVDKRVLAELEGQLFEHMLPHMNAIRPLLDQVTARLYEGEGEA